MVFPNGTFTTSSRSLKSEFEIAIVPQHAASDPMGAKHRVATTSRQVRHVPSLQERGHCPRWTAVFDLARRNPPFLATDFGLQFRFVPIIEKARLAQILRRHQLVPQSHDYAPSGIVIRDCSPGLAVLVPGTCIIRIVLVDRYCSV